MSTTARVITRHGSVKDLVEILQQNTVLATQIKSYFQPYCDCDITIWLIEQINNDDIGVINKIRELIAAEDDNVLTRSVIHPEQNVLLSTFCIGQDLYGKYATGTGGITEILIKETSTTCGCQPYKVNNFNWALFPSYNDNTAISQFYNNPLNDGVTLNIGMCGNYYAWNNNMSYDPSTDTVIFMGLDTNPMRLDGALLTATDTVINTWTASQYFTIDDSTVTQKYNALNETLNINVMPHHMQFPGVSSFNAWRSRIQTSPHPVMAPTVFEMWYSLNENRTNPTNGFCNYTFLGDAGADAFPAINLPNDGDFIRQYCAGIFKTTTRMLRPVSNVYSEYSCVPEDLSDCPLAFIFDGGDFSNGETGGVLKIITNGQVYQSITVNFKVVSLSVIVDFITDKQINEMGSAKSIVSEASITISDFSGNNTRSITVANPFEIDTYHIKYAWGTESSTNEYVYSCRPPMFYTLPGFDIQCDPGQPMPPFVLAPSLAW